jgi:lipopolysaccharide transport system ATP-binding protein
MSSAISISGVGKRYMIGAAQQRADTLRDAITAAASAPFRRLRHAGSSTGRVSFIWALRDVSFDVDAGQVIGIIGRNGAGKSTLLKILTRITEPTEGRVVINGRVGSLLEVGTGFHQELSGRENIYLNGAILGMTRVEIGRKFDDIVEFSEIAPFLDTPVKRYSTGMYVRLAFAVAAHLDPEILLVDEVLSVGDVAFQRKCLGQMEEIAGSGRTVFLVSHNMNAVRNLCSRVVEIEGGHVVADGRAEEIVSNYIARQLGGSGAVLDLPRPLGDPEELVITSVRVVDGRGSTVGPFHSNEPVYVEIDIEVARANGSYQVGFDLLSGGGVVLRTWHTDGPPEVWPEIGVGRSTLRCTIPAGLLNDDSYAVVPRAGVYRSHWLVNGDESVWFDAVKDHLSSPYSWIKNPGSIAPQLDWQAVAAAGEAHQAVAPTADGAPTRTTPPTPLR